MALRDAVADRQAEPGTLADGLRREERLEDPRQYVQCNPRSRVGHAHSDPAVRRHETDRYLGLGAPYQRLLRVEHQVQDHLLELCRISTNGGNAFRHLADQLNALKAESVLPQGKGPRDDVPHVDPHDIARPRTPEGL